ncbi:protein C10 isoform X1 [Emydura macquarii macquarii]|uniref:protein C10 isoform X1 n=1 Tax=Emydura macquarii macquarii TaxID=1129001 RepID=UPI003529ED82
MEDARENACNDMGKMLQFLLPVATQVQQEVIRAYGFSNDGEGRAARAAAGLPGGSRIPPPGREHTARGPEIRPTDKILRVPGPGDRKHVREAKSHVPAANDAAPTRAWDRAGGRGSLLKTKTLCQPAWSGSRDTSPCVGERWLVVFQDRSPPPPPPPPSSSSVCCSGSEEAPAPWMLPSSWLLCAPLVFVLVNKSCFENVPPCFCVHHRLGKRALPTE